MRYKNLVLILCILILFSGCKKDNVNNSDYCFQGRYTRAGYDFTVDGIGISTDRFMYSGWDEVAFEYICTDLTCNHSGEGCTSLALHNYDISYSRNIYFNDKMIILETYEVSTFSDDGQRSFERFTDIYEADKNGGNRKLIKTINGGVGDDGNYIVVDNMLFFGGKKVEKYEKNNIKREQVIISLNLNDYSIKEFEVDSELDFSAYYLYVYEEKIYVIARTSIVFEKMEIIDYLDEKWYEIDYKENTCKLINELYDTDVTFFGVIGDYMYYSYYDKMMVYRKNMGTNEEEEFVEIHHDIPVAIVHNDNIIIMTDAEMQDEECHIKYTWYDEEKKEIKCYEYDEWLIMDVFIGDKLVYMKPFENRGAYYWISSDDIINMENAGTYIGPLSTIEFDTIGMEEIS